MPSAKIECETHGIDQRPWVICVHVAEGADPKIAERLPDEPSVGGHVLCDACVQLRTAGSIPHLRMACEGCVLKRWTIQEN